MWYKEPISGIIFCILMSLNIKIQDGRHLPIPFFSVLSHITHITCWISHEKLVFSNMCLFPGIISCILTSPNIKIQDGHQRPYWKFNSKENSHGNRYNIPFPIDYCTQSPFLKSFCILTSLNVEIQDDRPLPSVNAIRRIRLWLLETWTTWKPLPRPRTPRHVPRGSPGVTPAPADRNETNDDTTVSMSLLQPRPPAIPGHTMNSDSAPALTNTPRRSPPHPVIRESALPSSPCPPGHGDEGKADSLKVTPQKE